MSGPPSHPPGYPPPAHGYPYPYPPPPRRDNGRAVAIVIAVVIVGGLGVAAYYGLQRATKNYEIQRQAGSIADLYGKAANLYQAGKFSDAAPLFHQVRENPASSVEMIGKAATGEAFCYRMLGQQAQDAHDLAAAVGWFQKAVAAAPDDPGAKEELAAVQKAIGLMQGTGTGNPNPDSRNPDPGGSHPMPGFDPSKEPDEATKKAQDAAEITERGKVLLSQGRNRDACAEWHEAILKAPGSPGGVEAASLKQQYCPNVP